MNKDQKSDLVSSLKEKLTNSACVSIVHYRGMSDKELYTLRTALKEKECNMKIAKNTLVKLAIKGTDLEELTEHLNGPTAVVYSQDPVSLAKTVSDVSKESENLQIKIGYFNKSLVTENAIKNMAKLGSLEEVRASFIGKLKGAQANFVRLLTAPEQGLAENKS